MPPPFILIFFLLQKPGGVLHFGPKEDLGPIVTPPLAVRTVNRKDGPYRTASYIYILGTSPCRRCHLSSDVLGTARPSLLALVMGQGGLKDPSGANLHINRRSTQ